ncbi:MAG: pyruvate dehydrogenase [Desulfobacterales bacterium SG8_35_2]|nr:MAG: pyruvate dehydrogenase [Desulfobacterales bacterium SG8_35_2]
MTVREMISDFDWPEVTRLVLTSRIIDEIEENELYPKRLIPYQFSARGHELTQVLLGSLLTHKHDGLGAYYRSRPISLALGLSIEDVFAASLAKTGSHSDGRDIGAVINFPSQGKATIFPIAGDVGSQYTPAAGWAQAIEYRYNVLKEPDYKDAIAVVQGGEGSVATNGFWSALTIATTLKLPLLFCIEDNGYAISVMGDKQTPGGNIAKNLSSFTGLKIFEGNGSNPVDAAQKIKEAVNYVRDNRSPVLLRMTVPRLCGHSGQDTQAYKSQDIIENENKRDPVSHLYDFLVPGTFTSEQWQEIRNDIEKKVRTGLRNVINLADPETGTVEKHVFQERDANGNPMIQVQGGLTAGGHPFLKTTNKPNPEPTRINMLTAIRRTLEVELQTNPKVLIFGEDVGPKGGVHAATMHLQEIYGEVRVFDTSLSEEGIIGRAVGMALAGLMPVAEIQFRKYADPATEQLNNCGTIRWRTNNRFAAPIVVRMPGGFSKVGDPWHSVSGEVFWAHNIGWQLAFPSNAEDAVGLLRAAMRGNNPTIFFEHRALLDGVWARRPYPGDNYVLPFGKAKMIQEGDEVSIVTWGAMVERCEAAAKEAHISADIIDLRTIMPWDKGIILDSVTKTRRCLVVHEDNITAGFGAEIVATISKEAFFELDAPLERLCMPDIPVPYNIPLMNSVVPSIEQIAEKIREIVEF